MLENSPRKRSAKFYQNARMGPSHERYSAGQRIESADERAFLTFTKVCERRARFMPIGCAALAAGDGTITGKVTGKGSSVVYVEAVAGKTFPAPAKLVQIDQKSLLFQPHIVVAPVGSTVEFLNNDKVAHNIFWPA